MKHKNILKINHTKLFTYSVVLFIFFCSSIFSYQWLKSYQKITITDIFISETKILNELIYEKLLASMKGLELNQKNLKKIIQLLEQHPYIDAVRASYRYPTILKVEILELPKKALV